MNKSLLTFLLLVLAFALPGTVKAETAALTLASGNTFTSTKTTITQNDVSWTVTQTGGSGSIGNWQSSNYKGQQFGSSSAAWSGTFSTSDIKGTITSVKVSANTGGAATVSVTVGGEEFGGDAQSVSKNTANCLDYTFNGSASGEISVLLNGTSKACYLAGIEVTYSTGSEVPDDREDLTLSFSAETAVATVGEPFTAPALNGLPEGATVDYSSSDANVATVAEDGTVTPLFAGETTITASFAGNDTYKPTTASYVLTVNPDPNAIAETITVDNFASIATSYGSYSANTAYANYTVCAMKGATSNPGLQMNNNSTRTCGIIIAAKDGYYIKSITPSTSTSGKTFNVYSSATAFTSVDNLKSATALNATPLASGTTYTFTGETLYAGAGPSENGAMYGNTFTVEFGKATPTVATPAISFDAATNTVTIVCATEGASVEYSLDGENWQSYTVPFVIEKDCTVSARATMADMNDSAVATLDCKWTDLNAVAAPTFSLEEGEYLYGTELTIKAAEGCSLTVMIGEEFLEDFANGEYTFNLIDDVEIVAVASKDGNDSEEATATYLVRDPKAATATIADGEVVEGKSVSFAWEEVPGFTYTVTDENEAVLATGNADEAYTFNTLGTVLVTLSGKVYDKTFTQEFLYEVVEKPAAEYYVLVTDASQLQNGDQIVVAGAKDGAYYAMTNTTSSSRIKAAEVTVTDNYIVLEPEQTEIGIFALRAGSIEGSYAIEGENGYVYGSNTNTDFTTDASKYIFKEVTIAKDGAVSITISSDNRKLFLFKTQDFRGYSSKTNDSSPVYFYKKSLGKKANVAIEFEGEEEFSYLEDAMMFTYEGAPADATINTVVKDAEGNEVEDIDADNSGVFFTAPAAHTYTVTASVAADFNYAPASVTATVHVLPLVQLISQNDHYVWESEGTIGVHEEGTAYTIRNYEHGTLALYYKHDKNGALRANAAEAEDAHAGFTKYAGEELFIEPGDNLTYYFGNEAGEKVGQRSFAAAIPTGVEAIEVSADADAEYYTLQGVRVSASKLTTGLYIRRQGNTATKVMVK